MCLGVGEGAGTEVISPWTGVLQHLCQRCVKEDKQGLKFLESEADLWKILSIIKTVKIEAKDSILTNT